MICPFVPVLDDTVALTQRTYMASVSHKQLKHEMQKYMTEFKEKVIFFPVFFIIFSVRKAETQIAHKTPLHMGSSSEGGIDKKVYFFEFF